MNGWRTQRFAESIGMTVKGFLKSRLDAGCTHADIAREVGANNRQAICRLVKRHGLSRKQEQTT